MIQKLYKYITPLRIIGVWLLIWAIIEYINTEKLINQGHEPGLGGLGFIALGAFSLLFLFFDLILSLALKKRNNWIIQIVLVLILILWVVLSEVKK